MLPRLLLCRFLPRRCLRRTFRAVRFRSFKHNADRVMAAMSPCPACGWIREKALLKGGNADAAMKPGSASVKPAHTGGRTYRQTGDASRQEAACGRP